MSEEGQGSEEMATAHERAKRLAGIRELQHFGPDAPAFWLAMQVPFLITEIDAAREDYRHAVSDFTNALAEIDAARAQVARLREALEDALPYLGETWANDEGAEHFEPFPHPSLTAPERNALRPEVEPVWRAGMAALAATAPEGEVDRGALAAMRREGEKIRQEIAKRVAPMTRGPRKWEGE